MTQAVRRQYPGSVSRRLAAWIAMIQQQLSDRVFADGDAFARDRGWEIANEIGRFGFGSRSYRDPQFDRRAAETRHGSEYTWGRRDA
jgi:hypothetical protein